MAHIIFPLDSTSLDNSAFSDLVIRKHKMQAIWKNRPFISKFLLFVTQIINQYSLREFQKRKLCAAHTTYFSETILLFDDSFYAYTPPNPPVWW